MSVSSKELELRQEVLDDLDNYITKCQADIMAMMETLEWTPEHFIQPRKMSVCKYNSDHKMPNSALEKHEKQCELRSQGYSKEEVEEILEDTSYYYKNADCVHTIKIDKETLNSALWKHHVENHSVFYGLERMPRTMVEEEQLLSREDRLGLAQYVISAGKEANRLKDLEKSELLGGDGILDLMRKGDKNDTKLNPLEEIAALRDYRRRRQTYRAKNVHITKKSHTEVLREVITNQMEMLEKSLQEETGTGNQGERLHERSNDRDTRQRNDRQSRSRSRSREKHKRSRSRARNEMERFAKRHRNEAETNMRQENEKERSSRHRIKTETITSQGSEREDGFRNRIETEIITGQGKERESSDRHGDDSGNSTSHGIKKERDETEISTKERNETNSASMSRNRNEIESESVSLHGSETVRSDSGRLEYRSRSRSEDGTVRQSSDRDRGYSKSPSRGSDRHKKHKHKKHKKHKHKHKKSRKHEDVSTRKTEDSD